MLNDHSEPYIESNDNPKGIDLIIITYLDKILTKEVIKYIIINNPAKDFYVLKGTIYFPYYLLRFEDCY